MLSKSRNLSVCCPVDIQIYLKPYKNSWEMLATSVATAWDGTSWVGSPSCEWSFDQVNAHTLNAGNFSFFQYRRRNVLIWNIKSVIEILAIRSLYFKSLGHHVVKDVKIKKHKKKCKKNANATLFTISSPISALKESDEKVFCFPAQSSNQCPISTPNFF